MKKTATQKNVECVKEKIISLGFSFQEIKGSTITVVIVIGNKGKIGSEQFLYFEGVENAISISKPYLLVSKDLKEKTIVNFGDEKIGDEKIILIAGPCSVENKNQIFSIAEEIKNYGINFLRGGAFKPRTSPYSFQGLKNDAISLLKEVKEKFKMKLVTEVMDVETLPLISEVADCLQIGARNMQNYSLLEAIGKIKIPVLLKRGFSATIDELLMSAEYILKGGNENVILCERGIRTFETATRNTLDLNAIPVLKKLTHLPVIVDPSHGIGIWDAVLPMSLAAIACGADGLIIETHNDPMNALSDGYQSIKPNKLKTLIDKLKLLAPIVDRKF